MNQHLDKEKTAMIQEGPRIQHNGVQSGHEEGKNYEWIGKNGEGEESRYQSNMKMVKS